jgi:copper(I)-binding protein
MQEISVRFLTILLMAVVAVSGAVRAEDYKVKDLTIAHAWTRPTPGGVKNGVVYVTLTNGGEGDRLLKAASPMAADVSLHDNIRDGDIIRMRDVDAIDLPAGKTVELKPGGLHIMMIGLTTPLKKGQTFPLTLTFAQRGEVAVQVTVGE